jgi:hypothetical protein
MVNVTFNVTPSDAVLTVKQGNTEIQPITPGGRIYALEVGESHSYNGTAANYLQAGGSLTPVVGQTPITLNLPHQTVNVTFVVEPTNATLTLKDNQSNDAPSPTISGNRRTYALNVGVAYTFSASAANYIAFGAETITPTTESDVTVTLERQTVLIKFAVPYGAKVEVKNSNSQVVAQIPGTELDPDSETVKYLDSNSYNLALGLAYSYSVTLTGYQTATGTHTVTAANTVTVNLTRDGGTYPTGWSKWRPSFGVYILNRDGTTGKQIGNWDYDETAASYGTGSGNSFVESPLITTFGTPLVYSGIDSMPAARLGVVKKGITAQSIIDYYNSHNGTLSALNSSTVDGFNIKLSTNSQASEDPYTSNDPSRPGTWDWTAAFDKLRTPIVTRYYYPDFLIHDPIANLIAATNLTGGTPVEAVIAVQSYNDRINRLASLSNKPGFPVSLADGKIDNQTELTEAINFLASIADTERALRNFEGMLPANNTKPLGSDGSYYIGSVWITPPYKNITVNGGTVVYTSDGQLNTYPRAATGEVVTFLVGDTFQIDSVTIPGVEVNSLGGREYSFTMPDSAVAVTITQPTPHNIAVSKSSNAVVVDVKVNGNTATSAIVGDNITFTVSPDDNYILNSVEVKNGENIISHTLTEGVYSFTMPDSAVTITVTLTYSAQSTKYAVTVNSSTGGTVTTDKDKAIHNDTITLTVIPKPGKQLKSLKYNDTTITLTDGKYSFYMPESDVTVSVEFEDITYPVNIVNGITGGTVSASPSTAAEGTTVTISVTSDDEYQLVRNSLKVNNGAVTVGADNKFTMPSNDVTITAQFEKKAYNVTIGTITGGEHGSVRADKASAEKDEVVTLTITSDAGYRLKEGTLKVNGESVSIFGKTYELTMPGRAATITAEFEAFSGTGDISANVWDGKSIDVSWFNPANTMFEIGTPAQLAGLAALVNGIYNNGIDTFYGNVSYIHDNYETSGGREVGDNNETTASYHYGDYDFKGKTVKLVADIDMGNANYSDLTFFSRCGIINGKTNRGEKDG